MQGCQGRQRYLTMFHKTWPSDHRRVYADIGYIVGRVENYHRA